MDLPSTEETQDLERLEWLYDAGAAVAPVDVLATLAEAGLAFDLAQRWVLDADRKGLLEEGPDSALVPERRLTASARLLVERARRRRSDRSHRRRVAVERVLAWTDAVGGNLVAFPGSAYGTVDGAELTFKEAAAAGQALHDQGLVKAQVIGAWGVDVARMDLTVLPAGQTCIDDFDGDVQAYLGSREPPGAGQTVHITQHTGAISVGGHGSTPNAHYQGVDTEAVRHLAQALADAHARGLLSLSPELEGELDEQVAALRTDDPGAVRAGLRWVANLATQTAAGAFGGVLSQQALQLLAQM